MWTNLRTEYSFKRAYGPVKRVAELVSSRGGTAAAAADLGNTFGHYPWAKACKDAGIKPVFGITVAVVAKPEEREKQPTNLMSLLALNNAGLSEIYELVRTSYDHFYFEPRVGYSHINALSADVAKLSGTWPDTSRLDTPRLYGQLSPGLSSPATNDPVVAALDNYYPTLEDYELWQLFADKRFEGQNQHILTEDEYLYLFPEKGKEAIAAARDLLEEAEAMPGRAPMVVYDFPEALTRKEPYHGHDLEEYVRASNIRVDLSDPVYEKRLRRELDLIAEKGYADYFFIVADMCNWAKRNGILVGPSRGSSAGSLVCYILGITEIDPIPHGLIFERFIDINRDNLPDIDIDFPDSRRDDVIQYLVRKYGADRVAKIGTISTMQPKGAIGEFAKAMSIPPWETAELKDAIIERSGGDARAAQCLEDTFKTDVGRRFIEKYPAMIATQEIEGHARHSGVHAAGVVVCPSPLRNYCGIDTRAGVAMVDKRNAEKDAGLLKIDVLGLRTLSILQDTLDEIGKDAEWLYNLPTDDEKTFEVFTARKLDGIFQFEGYALQSLTKVMNVENFDDIVAITSLARPGPLHNGGAMFYAERRMGRQPVTYLNDHPAIIDITSETYGTIVFQEQVMRIVREVGRLSWEDTSMIRKTMSDTMGDEFFNSFWVKFRKGAMEEGLTEAEARSVWDNVMTFGSWGFNKSHAVSYGLISYWCGYFKAHHPAAFTVATMNHLKSEDQGIKVLREYVSGGHKYVDVDKEASTDRWVIRDGVIYGPLTNIKGIGPKVCEDIIKRREEGRGLTPAQQKKIDQQGTIYRELWPAETHYGDFYKNPRAHNILNHPVSRIIDVQERGTYVFIGRLADRNLRDHNEYGSVVKRGYEMKGPTLFLNFNVEDDTDSIICTIPRNRFEKLGRKIAESGQIGKDWYLIKGSIKDDWRRIEVQNIRRITKDDKAISDGSGGSGPPLEDDSAFGAQP